MSYAELSQLFEMPPPHRIHRLTEMLEDQVRLLVEQAVVESEVGPFVLRDLASMNNGQYQYVDVRRLGRPGGDAARTEQGDVP